MRTLEITTKDAGQRLDKYLAKYMEQAPKSFFYKMLRKKNIKLNGKKAEGNERLQAGDVISLYLSEETIEGFRLSKRSAVLPEKSMKKLEIIYEDEDILIVNKPVGVLSQKADRDDVSLIEYIDQYLAGEDEVFRPGICNRLDRNTSGLVVAGKSVQGLQWMNQLFRERNLKKYYLCVVHGRIRSESKLQGYLYKDEKKNKVTVFRQKKEGAGYIETEYTPLCYGCWNGEEYTLLRVHLITGKSHQIRAHLSSIGCPIIGDVKYGDTRDCQQMKKAFGLRCQLLHAWKLEFREPLYLPEKYHNRKFTAPIPGQFQKILRELGISLKGTIKE